MRPQTSIVWSVSALATAGLTLLLVLTIMNMAGAPASQQRVSARVSTGQETAAVRRAGFHCDPRSFASARAVTPSTNAFYTTAFLPPAPPANPKPPTSKTVEVVYQGVFESSSGTREALVRVTETTTYLRLGSTLASDWAVASISLRELVVTNRSHRTVTLPFSRKTSLEVPIP